MSEDDEGGLPPDQSGRGGKDTSLPAVRAKNSAPGANAATVRKILEGAGSAIARHGTRKLSMRDICDAAGVSPGTLYRYFATKEEVLTAVSTAISTAFEEGVREAAAAYSDPIDRFRAVLDFHFQLSQKQQSDGILEVEPKFTLTFLQDHFGRHVSIVKSALSPAFDLLDRTTGMVIDRDLFCEILIRMGLSTLLVPGGAVWRSIPGVLTGMVRAATRSDEVPPLRSGRGGA